MFKNNDKYELSYDDIRIISRYYFDKEREYENLYESGCNGFGVKDIKVDLNRMKENRKLWEEIERKKEDGYKIEVSVKWNSSFD